jgi:hypothetical protein
MNNRNLAVFTLFVCVIIGTVLSIVLTLPKSNNNNNISISSTGGPAPNPFIVPSVAYPLQTGFNDLVSGNVITFSSIVTYLYGTRGNAIHFDTNFVGPISSIFTFTNYASSVCFWFKAPTSTSVDLSIIGSPSQFNTVSSFNFVYGQTVGSSLQPAVYIGYGNQGSTCSNTYFKQSIIYTNTSWNHYCMIGINTGTWVPYLNGQIVQNQIITTSLWGPTSVNLGNTSCFSNLRGDLQGLAFWNVTIPSSQVLSIYNKQLNLTSLTLQTWT